MLNLNKDLKDVSFDFIWNILCMEAHILYKDY